jgi:hypothetical protein
VPGSSQKDKKIQNKNPQPMTVGKYLISPLVKSLENGWFASSVSIRSGSGTGTTDRVVRLTKLFQTQLQAAEYALQEGLQWIGMRPQATVH